MATVTFKGTDVHTNGDLPVIGSKAFDFVLTDGALNDHGLSEYRGRKKLLSIVPSLDTGTCALSAKKFNEAAKKNPNIVILVISADLPFAQKRMCAQDNLENIITLSMLRSKDFAMKYGVLLTDGPLAGLASRAVIVLDENDTVVYRQLVKEITTEPDYEKALAFLR